MSNGARRTKVRESRANQYSGLRQVTGQVVWTGPVYGGIDGSPAVTSDAVYVSDSCLDAYAFNPLDGVLLWPHKGTCNGGGIATLVYYQEQLSVGYSSLQPLPASARSSNSMANCKHSTSRRAQRSGRSTATACLRPPPSS
jgi:hypothetical protein